MDEIQIFDRQGQERDWDWLVASYGAIRVKRAQVPEGVTKVYRIVKLQDVEGPAVQVVNVSDQENNPIQGTRVVRRWPDAPQLPAWPAPISMWYEQGVYGGTNENGDVGFGMGHGDYYFVPEEGASCVWVAARKGPSDLISGLGMLGGTNHRHLDVYYQLQDVKVRPPEKSPEKPPERPPEEGPVQPSGDRWQLLMDKLDDIIALLEERVG